MTYNIGHSQKKNRFEVECLGQTAFLEYIVAEGVMEIRHTIVPAELEGHWSMPGTIILMSRPPVILRKIISFGIKNMEIFCCRRKIFLAAECVNR